MVSRSPYNASEGGAKKLKNMPQLTTVNKPRSPYAPCGLQIKSSPFREQTLKNIGTALREGKAAAGKMVQNTPKIDPYKIAKELYDILQETQKLEDNLKTKGWDALIELKAIDPDVYRKLVSCEHK